MPVKNGVGYSNCTSLKLEHLCKIFGMHIRISRAVMEKNRYFSNIYHYIDATAGPGMCPDDRGLRGSPLVFRDVASRAGVSFKADLIERNKSNYDQLRTEIPSYIPNIKIHHGTYENIIPRIAPSPNSMQIGLIFFDPTDVPESMFEAAKYIANKRSRMEILFYLSATNIKRAKKRRLTDYIGEVGKKYWLVRKPMSQFQWTFILGSDTDLFTDYASIGFYRLDSERGVDALASLDLTRNELKYLAPYYEDYIKSDEWQKKSSALKDKIGKCQMCGGDCNLQGHHNTYKTLGKEGTYDVTVLCTKCHELFHNHRRIQ